MMWFNIPPPYEDYYICMCEGAVKPTSLYYADGKWTDDQKNEYHVLQWTFFPAPPK